MTLEELGNLGEFVGAIGVVVSFFFLAIQIRQNTRALRSTAAKEMAQHTAEFLLPIVENADVARIFRVGLQDWDTLDQDDRMRFSMHLFGAFYYFQQLFIQHRERQIDLEYWTSQKTVIFWYLRQPGVRRWWGKARSRLIQSFVDFVEAESEGAREV